MVILLPARFHGTIRRGGTRVFRDGAIHQPPVTLRGSARAEGVASAAARASIEGPIHACSGSVASSDAMAIEPDLVATLRDEVGFGQVPRRAPP
jgi:hypothetical protein